MQPPPREAEATSTAGAAGAACGSFASVLYAVSSYRPHTRCLAGGYDPTRSKLPAEKQCRPFQFLLRRAEVSFVVAWVSVRDRNPAPLDLELELGRKTRQPPELETVESRARPMPRLDGGAFEFGGRNVRRGIGDGVILVASHAAGLALDEAIDHVTGIPSVCDEIARTNHLIGWGPRAILASTSRRHSLRRYVSFDAASLEARGRS